MVLRVSGMVFLCLWIFISGTVLGYGERKANPLYEPPDPSLFDSKANLFRSARVTASGHWANCVPEHAINGRSLNRREHWAAENIPVWLCLDLNKPQAINALRLWTYWGDGRFYQYLIEGSLDGKQWIFLIDQRQNQDPAGPEGDILFFPCQEIQYLRITFTHNSRGDKAGGHIVEIEGYNLDPQILARERIRKEAWEEVTPGLHGAFGSMDVRYPRNEVPAIEDLDSWSGLAWRGERIQAQLVLWTKTPLEQVRLCPEPLVSQEGKHLEIGSVKPCFVRYVLAEDRVVGDVLDEAARLDLPPQSARPVWIIIEVPQGADPGLYQGPLRVESKGGHSLAFHLEVEVLPLCLKDPADWEFHLDLWQNPYALARYHHVEPWSPEHFEVLEPHLRLLARAGQKCLSTTIIHQPWGTQTYDPYESMVKWIRGSDGSFTYDFTRFDQYVELGIQCGLDQQINCYSMVPWTNQVRIWDKVKEEYETIPVKPGEEGFEKLWRPFLKSFVEHLRKKGWHHRVAIAMDERPFELMKPTIDLVREAAPELKIALAGKNEPRLSRDIDDWCVFISPPLDPAIVKERNELGLETTFYVCCSPNRPNTFTFSPPAEAAWIGFYAAARRYTGFLRWAYDSWVEDPLYDTKHVTWSAGDCFLVYPNLRSSIRFERLREGIQEYEKIQYLRGRVCDLRSEEMSESESGEVSKTKSKEMWESYRELEAKLSCFTYERATQEPAAELVNQAKEALARLSRLLSHSEGYVK